MSSTFFGLNIAGSGLNVFQSSINTTANNIANVDTEGYSRQVVNKEASSALRVFEKYGSTSTGVTAVSVTQMRDEYYDIKYWESQSEYGYFEKKEYYMNQIEDYYTDKEGVAPGFSTLFADMFNNLYRVETDAGDLTTRTNFVSGAQKLVTFFRDTSEKLDNLQVAINDEIKSTVDEINAISKKISMLNKQINVIEVEGGYANDLRDARALLIDELSEIVAIDVEEEKVANPVYPDMYTGATTFKVKINGQMLVNNYTYNELACTPRKNKYNQSDVEGLYDIEWKASCVSLNVLSANQSGSLKAMFEMRDGADGLNLKGYIGEDSTQRKIVLENPNEKWVEQMNLPSTGVLTFNSTQYKYSSFEAFYETEKIAHFEKDADGVFQPQKAYKFSLAAGATTALWDEKTDTGIEGKDYFIKDENKYKIENLVEYTRDDGELGKDYWEVEVKLDTGELVKKKFSMEVDSLGTTEPAADAKDGNGYSLTTEGKDYFKDTDGNYYAIEKIVVPVYYDDNQLGTVDRERVVARDEYGQLQLDRDEDGIADVSPVPKIVRYEFQMEDMPTLTRLSRSYGIEVEVGKSIDTKGVVYYQNQMNEFIRTFAKRFNDTHQQGEDLNGDSADAFFVATSQTDDTEYRFNGSRMFYQDQERKDYSDYDEETRKEYRVLGISSASDVAKGVTGNNYYQLTVKTFSINSTISRDVNKIAATTNINNGIDNNDLVREIAKLESKVRMFRGGTADKFLQCIYADITVDAQEANVFSDNYNNIKTQVEKQRKSVAGVDEDEEAMNLVKFQNAYNLNSKVISVLAEMYDQLILRTGV